jgi:hypothetical protein
MGKIQMNQLYPDHPTNVVANIAGAVPLILAVLFIFFVW